MSLKKAMLLVERSKSQETIEVLFNPNEYAIESSNQFAWQTIPGLQAPIAQFLNGDASTLTMDIFFDTYEREQDVRDYTTRISGLLEVDKDLNAPPICSFVWGSMNFKGVLERVSQRFTMFTVTGIPVRATLNVTFKAVESMLDQQRTRPPQSASLTKTRIVKQGEDLWMIAHEEYEDPGKWRSIASANGISNPRRLETGKKLTIPRLE